MIEPREVHEILRRYQLVDGFDLVVDLDRSHGSWLFDELTGEEFLDGFTCFASSPLGYNHPGLRNEACVAELGRAATNKLANSDLYTREMAGFVRNFATHVTPEGYPHHFWVSGGSLAVENALKVAFDWKARKLGRTDFADDVNDLVVLHFEHAFHGRSGYTMSLTNTLPDKVGLFPKFDWPRVPAPAIEFDLDGEIANDIEAAEARSCAAIEEAFARHKGRVAAIIIETMQGEGGDNHFRPEFLAKLRAYADNEEALLIFDEVQTGFYGSGRPWLWQHHGIGPDIAAFGKKSQVCGIYANTRVDEVADNVFEHGSRINSTWGGNLVDMVRCRHFIEIIEGDGLAAHISAMGDRIIDGLRSIARETQAFGNVRGCGALIALTLGDPAARNALLGEMKRHRLIALPCGHESIRFRPPLTITAEEVDQLLERFAASVPAAVS